MAINHASKFDPKVAERFKRNSFTQAASSNAYKFDGVDTVMVYSVDTVPLGNYTRSGSNRYGTPADLKDSVQTLKLSQDKAFTYVVDKGDNEEQMGIKAANKALTREIDEQVIPTLDKYRLEKWVNGAGSFVTHASGTDPNKNSIIDQIMDCTEKLDEAAAPESGRVMFIANNMYKLVKEAPNFIYSDRLAQAALVKGQVGELDGMKVVKVPSSYLPAGVHALICHKEALLAPEKLREYKIHSDPPGLNGDLTEGRIIHDAFVLDQKADAVCVFMNAAAGIAPNVTITANTTAETVKFAATGADAIYYTFDGSDPRRSGTAVKCNANTTVNVNGVTITGIKAIAYDESQTVAWGNVASGTYA